MADNTKLKQVGVIVFGGGLDKRYAIEEARTQGYVVKLHPTYAELWKEAKKK